jgi:hypothetical protein
MGQEGKVKTREVVWTVRYIQHMAYNNAYDTQACREGTAKGTVGPNQLTELERAQPKTQWAQTYSL